MCNVTITIAAEATGKFWQVWRWCSTGPAFCDIVLAHFADLLGSRASHVATVVASDAGTLIFRAGLILTPAECEALGPEEPSLPQVCSQKSHSTPLLLWQNQGL